MKNYYLLSLQSIKANLFFGHKITQILQNFQISIVFFCIKIVFFTKKIENEHHCWFSLFLSNLR